MPVAASFVGFNYDQLDPARDLGVDPSSDFGDRWVIARATEFLDYTLGGVDFDPDLSGDRQSRGADEVHGESGDDSIHGQMGADVLFGDAQDDDLIGGAGHDWISGGTGQRRRNRR